MKIKAIIVEDVVSYIDTLKLMLSSHKNIELVATATNKNDAIKQIKKHSPDVLFMDIQLDKSTAFEILDECKNDYKYVIFTTSYDEFALKGYDYKAIHYLLKPIDDLQLAQAIEKLEFCLDDSTGSFDLKNTFFNVANLKSKKLFFPDKNIHQAIAIDAIIYLESDGAYTNLYTIDKTIKLSKNLGSIQHLLIDQPEFHRIHRSYLVNQNHIVNLKRGLESSLTMSNGHSVPISNNEKSNLFVALGIKE